ncbi:UNVERIFIED_CONTAM: hypothetical protein K2H54_062193 [Gekko kuhli]
MEAEAAAVVLVAQNQGHGTVAAYAAEFQLLAQDLAWNELALIDQFMEGLTDEVLDELAFTECLATLRTVVVPPGDLKTVPGGVAPKDRSAPVPSPMLLEMVGTGEDEPMQLGVAWP